MNSKKSRSARPSNTTWLEYLTRWPSAYYLMIVLLEQSIWTLLRQLVTWPLVTSWSSRTVTQNKREQLWAKAVWRGWFSDGRQWEQMLGCIFSSSIWIFDRRESKYFPELPNGRRPMSVANYTTFEFLARPRINLLPGKYSSVTQPKEFTNITPKCHMLCSKI